jgi:hypothetical protein
MVVIMIMIYMMVMIAMALVIVVAIVTVLIVLNGVDCVGGASMPVFAHFWVDCSLCFHFPINTAQTLSQHLPSSVEAHSRNQPLQTTFSTHAPRVSSYGEQTLENVRKGLDNICFRDIIRGFVLGFLGSESEIWRG